MNLENPSSEPVQPAVRLSALEARVLGCLIEKELATPDVYPLTLNALINACNQRSNRDPLMEVAAREVKAAVEGLRSKRLAALFSGADARGPKYKQTLDVGLHLETGARVLLCELLLRGPQTTAGLRGNAGRLQPLPAAAEVEAILAELAGRPSGAIVRKLPRQPGQKEARWVQLLTGEPAADTAVAAEPVKVGVTLPPGAEQRLAALEAEVGQLRAEVSRLKQALGG